ncbi:MAG: amidase family protein [Bifidobacterium tibiigranuli]|nr:amidase family protein [Bifidobacterium tibiigranuli]
MTSIMRDTDTVSGDVGDDLRWMSARQLASLIRSGELSAREALRAHWARIDAVNPQLNAIIYEDRESAWKQAELADARQAAGEPLGALHGVPMTNKDCNDTAGMPSTWGSPLLQGNVAKQDSVIVARLRAAGAVLTGKSNVPEFAAGAHTFNEVNGITRNPYDLTRSPGGSSGGVAASLAAGIQPIGDGSDMAGSLRVPAAFCNVLGLRPSRGRIPNPSPDSWAWLGCTGPMARETADMALMMSLLSGPDPRVPYSMNAQWTDTERTLRQGVKGLRIGYSPAVGLDMPVEPQVAAVCRQALAALAQEGAHIEEAAPNISCADYVFRQTRANDFEFAWGELVRANPEQVKPEMRENVAAGTRQTAGDLRELARTRTRLEGCVRDYFNRYDLWVTPTTQVLPFPAEWRYPMQINDQPMSDYLDWMRSVCVVSAMDVPALSVPAGFSPEGLPVGIQVVGPIGSENLLLRVAQTLEDITGFSSIHPAL